MSEPTRIVRRDAPQQRRASFPQPVAASPPDREKTRARRAWLTATLVAAVVALVLSQRMPCGPAAGVPEVRFVAARVPATAAARFRVGTYNIHGGKGLDGRRDLDRIAEVLRGLDFVGLNEVHGPALWEQGDQATMLGAKLHLAALFAPSERRWGHLETGNGALTRLDAEYYHVVPLVHHYDKSYRNLLHVRARAANGATVNLVVTHIARGDDRERREQLRTVGEYFLSLAQPAVLLGDLNSDTTEPELQRLLDEPGTVDALSTKLGFKAPPHIDWILVRGAEVTDAGMVPAGPSDHPHVWAELRVGRVGEGESGRGGDRESRTPTKASRE